MSRTVICKPAIYGGYTVVETFEGLPYDVPVLGAKVYLPGFGEATCEGVSKSGSGANETIDEVRYMLNISR